MINPYAVERNMMLFSGVMRVESDCKQTRMGRITIEFKASDQALVP